jgi:DNA-binding MarR family transcriptional regulator
MSSQVVSNQVLIEQTSGRAFATLLRAYAAVTRQLSTQLSSDHGLTLSDYEVLLRLVRAPERRMRRVDIAQEVLLTASGITRLLDGLEQSGFVERAACATDRRVVYAVLTEGGLQKLREASRSHLAQIDELFRARLDDDELAGLTTLLSRLDEGQDNAACEPPPD